MVVSPDLGAMVIALFAFAITVVSGVLGGVGLMLGRGQRAVDARFDRLEDETGRRFDLVDKRFEQVDKRFEQVDKRFEVVEKRLDGVDGRLTRVESELVEVKISIARLEGPPPRLQRI